MIMEDPVVADDEITYDRKAITLFFEYENNSPVTGKEFENKELISNTALLSEIYQFNQQKRPIALSETEKLDRVFFYMRNMIKAKEEYIEKILLSISSLTKIKNELEKELFNCKIANTTGSSASIVGTYLLFTPLSLVGVGTLIAGGLTSLATSVTQYYIEKGKAEQLKNALLEEEKTKLKYEVNNVKARLFLDAVNAAADAGMISSNFQDITYAARDLLAVSGTSKTSKISTSAKGLLVRIMCAGKISKGFAATSAAISAIDIISTWALDNETLEEIKKQIENKQRLANEEARELRDLKIYFSN